MSVCLLPVLLSHFPPPLFSLREVRDEGPGESSPRGKHHPAVRRDGGGHLLHPARGHQQKHGERQGLGRHGRHREAGQHHQGQGRQVGYGGVLFVPVRVHTDANLANTCPNAHINRHMWPDWPGHWTVGVLHKHLNARRRRSHSRREGAFVCIEVFMSLWSDGPAAISSLLYIQ